MGAEWKLKPELCAGRSRSRPGLVQVAPRTRMDRSLGRGVLCELKSSAAPLPFGFCPAPTPEGWPAAQVSSLLPPGPPAPPRPQDALTFRK